MRRSVIGGVATLALLAGCSSSSVAPDTTPRVVPVLHAAVPADGPVAHVRAHTDRPTVVIVGDSITEASRDAIGWLAAASEVSVLIDAEVGRRISGGDSPQPGTARLRSIRSRYDDPDLWVIALGTNDVPGYDDDDDYARLIDTLLVEVPADDPLLWVNVYLAGAPERSDAFNIKLAQALTARGNAGIVDWRTVAPGDGMLSDGVHPTSGDGVLAFSDLVVSAIRDWPLDAA